MVETVSRLRREKILWDFDPGVARSALTPGYYLKRLRRSFALRAHCRQDACAPSEPPGNAGRSDKKRANRRLIS